MGSRSKGGYKCWENEQAARESKKYKTYERAPKKLVTGRRTYGQDYSQVCKLVYGFIRRRMRRRKAFNGSEIL